MAVDHARLLEHIAGELDRLMTARSLTQSAVYRQSHGRVSQFTMSRILRARNVRLTTLFDVADALGVRVQVTFHEER